MIKISQITPLLKSGWIAQDKNGDIYWYSQKPYVNGTVWETEWETERPCHCESFKDFGCLKDIEHWADDWKDSLIEVKGVKTR